MVITHIIHIYQEALEKVVLSPRIKLEPKMWGYGLFILHIHIAPFISQAYTLEKVA